MKYDKLFETAKIGSLTLKNRFIMGAMGVGFACLLYTSDCFRRFNRSR